MHNFPILLFGASYWQGLLDWLRSTVLNHGNISAQDLDLVVVTDSPEEARDLIVAAVRGKSDRREVEAASVQQTAKVYAKG